MKPKICVLIPAYNEEVVIRDTISALFISGCQPHDIYVADDCSKDSTARLAKSLNINVVSTPVNGGKAAAQRFALEYFTLTKKYDWVVFMDGDTKVDSNFHSSLCDAVTSAPDTSLFIGQIRSINNNHVFSALRAVEYSYGQDVIKVGQGNFNVILVAPGCVSMYKTSILKCLSIDSDTLAEDMDLTMQVHRMGGNILYIPDAIVNTQDPSTLSDYFKQVLRWHRGFWQIVRKFDILKPTFKKQRVDWYMLYLILDSLLMNRLIVFSLMLFQIVSVTYGLLMDVTIYFLMCGYASYSTRRLDVLYKSPILYLLGYVNFYAYLRGFVEIILLRKNLLSWNKVTRYNIN